MSTFVRALLLGNQPATLVDASGNPIASSNPLPVQSDEIQLLILAELRIISRALVAIACDGNKNRPEDFISTDDPTRANEPL